MTASLQTHPIHAADSADAAWWRDAVIYQVYPRSFADADGDGIGDLPGVTARLPYLAALGVDALWLSPVLPLAAGRRRLRRRRLPRGRPAVRHARRRRRPASRRRTRSGCGASSTSCPTTPPTSTRGSRRRWPPGPGSPERDRYLFRDGRGATASCRPTTGARVFGGPAWTRVTEPDGTPGQWYLHLFDTKQPDLNWDNPEVRARVRVDVLRFWLDRGVDGFRVDVAHGLVKAGPARLGRRAGSMLDGPLRPGRRPSPPMWDQDGVHDDLPRLARGARRVRRPSASCAPRRGCEPPERAGALRPRPTRCTRRSTSTSCSRRGGPPTCARSIDESLAATDSVGAPTTWVLSNHDVVRHATRLGPAAGRTAAQRHRRRPTRSPTRRSACAGPARRPR